MPRTRLAHAHWACLSTIRAQSRIVLIAQLSRQQRSLPWVGRRPSQPRRWGGDSGAVMSMRSVWRRVGEAKEPAGHRAPVQARTREIDIQEWNSGAVVSWLVRRSSDAVLGSHGSHRRHRVQPGQLFLVGDVDLPQRCERKTPLTSAVGLPGSVPRRCDRAIVDRLDGAGNALELADVVLDNGGESQRLSQ